MKELKVGIIGFGNMGAHLGLALSHATGGLVTVDGVVDPDDEKYRRNCEFIGNKPRRCATIAELREMPLDGIIVASPNHCHLENIQELQGLSTPLLLEKPLDANFDKICDVLRFSEEYPGPIIVDHVMRYAPIISQAKELVDSGAIGQICSVSFVQNCFYGNSMYHCFRRTMAGSGGMFIEKATHDLDIMHYIVGARASRVAAVARRQAFGGNKPNDLHCRECDERFTCPESSNNTQYRYGNTDKMFEQGWANDMCVYAEEVDVPDNEVCMIEFDNGTFGTYTQCFFSPVSYTTREYEITGLEGILRLSLTIQGDHNKGRILHCRRFGTPEDSTVYEFDYRKRIHYNGGGAVARHFCQLMTGEAEPFTTVRQAFAAEVLGQAATLAAQRGEFVVPQELLPDDLQGLWEEL